MKKTILRPGNAEARLMNPFSVLNVRVTNEAPSSINWAARARIICDAVSRGIVPSCLMSSSMKKSSKSVSCCSITVA